MDKQQFEDLVLGAIDGTNSLSDQRDLEAYCAANPDDQQIYQNIVQTARTLDMRVPAEAPRHFANNVMREVRARAAAQTARPQASRDTAGIVDRIMGWFTMPRLVVSVGSAAIVLIAAAVYLQNPSGIDSDRAVGTMLGQDAIAGWQDVARHEITIAGVSGFVTLRQSGQKAAVEVNYRSDEPCTVTLAFDRSTVIPIDLPPQAHSAPGVVYLESTVAQAVSIFQIASDAQFDISVTVTSGEQQQTITLSPVQVSK